jgi:hypothetical protein
LTSVRSVTMGLKPLKRRFNCYNVSQKISTRLRHQVVKGCACHLSPSSLRSATRFLDERTNSLLFTFNLLVLVCFLSVALQGSFWFPKVTTIRVPSFHFDNPISLCKLKDHVQYQLYAYCVKNSSHLTFSLLGLDSGWN